MARSRKRKAARTPLLRKITARPPGQRRGRLAAAVAARGRRKAAPPREPLSEEARARLREIAALALFGATLFVLLSCVSWGRGDNLCGPTGEALAEALLGAVGYAAYLLVAVMGLWGGMLFTRVRRESFSLRASGLALCLVSFSALLSHVFVSVSGRFPPGGVVGEFINLQLMEAGGLGLAGTRIVLVVLTLITFVLATDVAYYASLVAGAAWLRERHAVHVAEKQAARAAGALRREERELGLHDEDEDDLDEDDLDDERDPVGGDGRASAAGGERRGLLARLLRRRGTGAGREGGASDEERRARALEAFEAVKDEPGVVPAHEALDDGARRGRGAHDVLDAEDAGDDVAAEDDEAGTHVEDDDLALLDEDGLDEVEADEDGADEDGAERDADDGPVPVRTTRDVPPIQLTFDDGPEEAAAAGAHGAYVFPDEDLLDEQLAVDQDELDDLLAEKTKVLEKTLASFKVEGKVVEIQKGPVISMFEMELAPGIKVEKVRSLEDDLAIALRARTVRIVAPIPGKNTIGIEVPNPLREVVRLKPLLHSSEYTEGKFALPIFLGKDAAGHPMVVDLAKMPHLLVAGATGSGKSVCLNTIILSLLYTRTPEQVKMILLDPKMVELSQFSHAPHLASPVVSDMKRAPVILDWAVNKMEERYKLLSGAGVRNIYSYNKLGADGLRERFGERVDADDFPRFLPFIVIIVDELADLMMTSAKEVEASITRLAAKSRAVGIHIILATQRPSTNVITGLIKANLPTRVAFMVSSKIDSRVILDVNGAEQLLGEGDMLFLPPHSSHVMRGQCTYVSEDEVRDVMKAIRTDGGPLYERELVQRRDDAPAGDPTEVDDLYDAAVRFVFQTQRGSASLLQRKFAIGYTRASRLIDLMAEEGVLGEYKGSQARELTMSLDDWIALNPEARGTEEDDPGAGA